MKEINNNGKVNRFVPRLPDCGTLCPCWACW